MIYPIDVSARAHNDADQAFLWIAQGSRRQAERWYQGLFKQIDTLAKYPLRCPLADENDKFAEEIRVLLYGKGNQRYRIIFTIRGDTVVVLYVRHAARDEIEP